MTIRTATLQDLESIMKIYAHARAYMKANGNRTQWKNHYPPEELIVSDIHQQQCYVCCNEEGECCGVFMFLIGDDPTYQSIEGKWLNNDSYGVIHRVASDGTQAHLFTQCLNFCLNYIQNLRIDTHEDNHIMQHVLETHGFVYCGTIYVKDGSPRRAYQRIGH
ncbi:MAG: N-acetyltransferase [Lachnospiraceae bacterium]